jgi:hypothetical protein
MPHSKLALAIAIAAACLPAAAQVIPPAPDYSWLFDDGSGTTAGALTGGADGELLGGAAFAADTPFAYTGNDSIVFDGDDDEVTVPALATALNGETALSLSMWIRADAIGVDRGFWEADANGDQDRFGLRYDDVGFNGGGDDVIKASVSIGADPADDENEQYESAELVQTTAWQHVCFTYEDGTGFKLYIDGVPDVPTDAMDNSTGALHDMDRFLIGTGPKAHWAGRIDEVAVWTDALTADNVEWLAANSIRTLPGPSTLALLGCGLALLSRGRRGGRAGSRREPDISALQKGDDK